MNGVNHCDVLADVMVIRNSYRIYTKIVHMYNELRINFIRISYKRSMTRRTWTNEEL